MNLGHLGYINITEVITLLGTLFLIFVIPMFIVTCDFSKNSQGIIHYKSDREKFNLVDLLLNICDFFFLRYFLF